MFTNYSSYDSGRTCPDCGNQSLTLVLKGEASAYKFWFECPDHDDCRFETGTRWGPKPSLDDFDDHTANYLEKEYDGVPELAVDDTVRDKAAELTREKAEDVSL